MVEVDKNNLRTIEITINYHELLMKYDDTSVYKKYDLPEGFHYEFYKPGDEEEWAKIHIESGEFTSIEKGLKHFHDFFDYFIDSLDKRCVFIVDSNTNEKVGTATISLLEEKEYGYEAAVDWVAIKRSYQGRKLSRPLISKFMEIANNLGHKSIILHTQTTTWLAAKLYLDYGFEILNKEDVEAWSILKALVNHEKLSDFEKATPDVVFDKRNIEIEKQLKEMYGTDEFNYGVYYKNGRHDVEVYLNGETYEYKYYIENENLRLEEVIDKKYKR